MLLIPALYVNIYVCGMSIVDSAEKVKLDGALGPEAHAASARGLIDDGVFL